MLDIQHCPSFVLAILIFQVVPGPGTIAILNAKARNGAAAGMAAVAGTLATRLAGTALIGFGIKLAVDNR